MALGHTRESILPELTEGYVAHFRRGICVIFRSERLREREYSPQCSCAVPLIPETLLFAKCCSGPTSAVRLRFSSNSCSHFRPFSRMAFFLPIHAL